MDPSRLQMQLFKINVCSPDTSPGNRGKYQSDVIVQNKKAISSYYRRTVVTFILQEQSQVLSCWPPAQDCMTQHCQIQAETAKLALFPAK